MSTRLVVIQARRGSSRLPDKVMMPILGKPLLQRMVERVLMARSDFEFVIATTQAPEDDAITELCAENHWPCFRGHATDLLDRHYQAALQYQADIILKIPSDVPLIDPQVIDEVLGFFESHAGRFDFVSNLHPPTWPDGNDVEVMTFSALKAAWEEATKPMEREHTTPFLWENPHRFRIGNVLWSSGKDYSMSHRFTIDYEEDYQFIKAVFEALYPTNPAFGLSDILQLLEEQPAIYEINAKFAGVNWYRNHLDELKTITAQHTKKI